MVLAQNTCPPIAVSATRSQGWITFLVKISLQGGVFSLTCRTAPYVNQGSTLGFTCLGEVSVSEFRVPRFRVLGSASACLRLNFSIEWASKDTGEYCRYCPTTCGWSQLPKHSSLDSGLPEWCFIWGYYGTHYRVRFYPPFGV